MRRFFLPFTLVVVLASAVALADSDRVVAQFESLAAAGISGEARLNPMKQGGTRIQGQLDGLQPNTEYVSLISLDGACTGGTEFARFTANPAGKGHYNAVVDQELSTIGSIAVQLVGDPTVQACAAVNQ